MNRIDERFNKLNMENRKALITFLPIGDPDIETSVKAIYTMQEEGADLIELGVPFSDPAADEPAVQRAYERALSNGTDIFKAFELVARIRDSVEVPMVFVLYYNIIVQYGLEKFFADCQKAGVDGLIILDLPFEECGEIAEYTDKYGVYPIHFISPVSKERIKKITKSAKGFLYCVLPPDISANQDLLKIKLDEFVTEIRENTTVPACLWADAVGGTCISEAIQYFDGVIAGGIAAKAIASGGCKEESISNIRAVIGDFKSDLAVD